MTRIGTPRFLAGVSKSAYIFAVTPSLMILCIMDLQNKRNLFLRTSWSYLHRWFCTTLFRKSIHGRYFLHLASQSHERPSIQKTHHQQLDLLSFLSTRKNSFETLNLLSDDLIQHGFARDHLTKIISIEHLKIWPMASVWIFEQSPANLSILTIKSSSAQALLKFFLSKINSYWWFNIRTISYM